MGLDGGLRRKLQFALGSKILWALANVGQHDIGIQYKLSHSLSILRSVS